MPDSSDKPLSAKAQRARATATQRDYRLHDDEPADEAIKRVARARVDSALKQLRRDAKVDLATAVHDTRKDMKKLRSVLRLVRDELGDDRYRAENERYRDAARLLARSRDAEVRLQTLSDLRERYGEQMPEVKELERALVRERERAAGNGDDPEVAAQLAQAAEAIKAGGAAIEGWPLESSGWELVRSGLKRSYRRGRTRFAAVRADPTPEAIHDWRKGVKDLWYHLRLLRNVWPEVMNGPAEEAHVLSDLLGDHHDLTVLAEDLHERDGDDPDTRVLLELTERRQRELLEAAVPLGERLYAEQPKQFATRLSVYWAAWQSANGTA